MTIQLVLIFGQGRLTRDFRPRHTLQARATRRLLLSGSAFVETSGRVRAWSEWAISDESCFRPADFWACLRMVDWQDSGVQNSALG